MEQRVDVLIGRRLGFLAGFLAYIAALWFLWDTRILYPLKIFGVFLHELSHGIAAILGGGSIQRIEISPNQGGVCHCGGGIRFLTLTSGCCAGQKRNHSRCFGAATWKDRRRPLTLPKCGLPAHNHDRRHVPCEAPSRYPC